MTLVDAQSRLSRIRADLALRCSPRIRRDLDEERKHLEAFVSRQAGAPERKIDLSRLKAKDPFPGPRCDFCGGAKPIGAPCENLDHDDWPHPPEDSGIGKAFVI